MSKILKTYTDSELEALETDAIRYRWLRDHTGNTVMRKLMKECQPTRWDELVDKDRKATPSNG